MSVITTINKDDRAIGLWLVGMVLLVFVMIVVGGATRLTESGLSMTDWQPVRGIIPPLSDAEWREEFAAYQQYPEFQKVNRGMDLAEFKAIYWWEYAHRLLGRFIGFAFAIPLLWFWLGGRIKSGHKPKLIGLLLLGGFQGLLGWWMVKSGLIDRPDVSHYRLTAHLMLALVIFAAILWVALSLLRPKDRAGAVKLRLWATGLVALVFLQLAHGGLVAGLKAGFVYNTWPLMEGALVPRGLFTMQPFWLNFTESLLTVQFNHRLLAYLLLVYGFILGHHVFRGVYEKDIKVAAGVVLASLLLQIILGILTLIHVVPVALGTLHQAGGVMVLAGSIFFLYTVRGRERNHV